MQMYKSLTPWHLTSRFLQHGPTALGALIVDAIQEGSTDAARDHVDALLDLDGVAVMISCPPDVRSAGYDAGYSARISDGSSIAQAIATWKARS